MKTDMAWTSLQAYEKLCAEGKDTILKARVLKYVLDHPGVTRDDIAEATGIRLASVCGSANPLVKEGLLREDGADLKSGYPRSLLWPIGKSDAKPVVPEQQGLF